MVESSTFVMVAHYVILDGSLSFPYRARWTKDTAVLRRSLAEVQGVAAGVNRVLETQVEGDAD